MGVRKNARYLTAAEREDFVRACVLVKADIVNPGDPVSQQYDRWDLFVAIHRMIQNAFAPGASSVNFGHGGSGAYSFFSWHRYFLYQLELELQRWVPGVMLPYWDWTDPTPLLTDDFLGPNGTSGTQTVDSGYFAGSAPGTGTNPTPAPSWWPSSLTGWNLSDAFPTFWQGALRRDIGGSRPSPDAIEEALNMTTYPAFQNAVESGNGLSPGNFHQMHNGLHGFIGGHMSSPTASPFDPIFYLHHCNIDRYWAMWQRDGHANTYPTSGGNAEHHRNDIMYPWTGGTSGYGTNVSMPPIDMPDFTALGAQHNVDTLDHRALGYTYDTLPIVGLALDRSGSMSGLTPDPMTTAAPDVTKWEAATRGISAFLQDCESAYEAKEAYVTAGVQTFRGNGQFTSVFGSTASGLVKASGSHSAAVFDAAVAGLSPSGGTPLADALTRADTDLVKAPYGNLPAGERRYLAILTDGKRTTGSTIASIPTGSLGDTAVFAMGFGTGTDVDYPALDQLVTKGTVLPLTTQVFHGENAGTIDKFFTNSLAEAIGYVPVVDPVLELFAGEHTHLDFYATSADDSFFISAQGMDFVDPNWSFHLVAPDGSVVYGDGGHGQHAGHGSATVTAHRGNGRLSLFLKRDGAPYPAWVGRWQLMVAYKARDMARMLMLPVASLLAPVSAGPVRGPRYHRKQDPRTGTRAAARLSDRPNLHGFDLSPPFTGGDTSDACNVLVNIYARTRLHISLQASLKATLGLRIKSEALRGMIHGMRAYGRVLSPTVDVNRLFKAQLRKSGKKKLDAATVLASIEADNPEKFHMADSEVTFKRNKKGAVEARARVPKMRGVHHVGVLVEGAYHPGPGEAAACGHGHDGKMGAPERFERVLSQSLFSTGK